MIEEAYAFLSDPMKRKEFDANYKATFGKRNKVKLAFDKAEEEAWRKREVAKLRRQHIEYRDDFLKPKPDYGFKLWNYSVEGEIKKETRARQNRAHAAATKLEKQNAKLDRMRRLKESPWYPVLVRGVYFFILILFVCFFFWLEKHEKGMPGRCIEAWLAGFFGRN